MTIKSKCQACGCKVLKKRMDSEVYIDGSQDEEYGEWCAGCGNLCYGTSRHIPAPKPLIDDEVVG